MATCEKIRAGLDMTCGTYLKKYYQQMVLVNRSDINNKLIVTSSVNIEDEYLCRNRVYFDLLEGKTGYRFTIGETASFISGSADKTEVEGIPQYAHSVSLILMGVDEPTKCLLSQLDYSDYFAALQFYDNTIEIFGFEYGLTTNGYKYDPSTTGGTVLTLQSLKESPEDELPFVYRSSEYGGEVTDFNNNFAENIFAPQGDFNDDFNDDFNNEE